MNRERSLNDGVKRNNRNRIGQQQNSLTYSFSTQTWTSPIYMGSNFQQINAVFDTAYDWTVVQNPSCSSCHGTTFEPTTSGTIVSAKTLSIEKLTTDCPENINWNATAPPCPISDDPSVPTVCPPPPPPHVNVTCKTIVKTTIPLTQKRDYGKHSI